MAYKYYTAKYAVGPAADIPVFSANAVDYRPFFYLETDTGILKWWNGTLWLSLNPQAGNFSLGTIPLPLTDWHVITTNDIGDLAVASGNGGKLAGNTTPILERINGATDKKLRVHWAGAVDAEIQQEFVYPHDLDPAEDVTLNLLVVKDANDDDEALITAGYFENVGDTDVGGPTAFITEIVPTLKTIAIAAAGIGAYPAAAAVTLTPSDHATDAISLLGSWITYNKLVS